MENDKQRMMAAMADALAFPNMRRYQIAFPDGVIDWKHGFKDGWIAARQAFALDQSVLSDIRRCVYESPLLVRESLSDRRALLEQVDLMLGVK